MNVSVIIPCFNASSTLERALLSVRAQTLKPCEIILIDDCSVDDTSFIMGFLAKSNPDIVTIKLEKNSGPGYARNIGWDRAKGDYVAFLDADDSWHKDKLKLQCELFRRNPEMVLCGCSFEIKRTNLKENKALTVSQNDFSQVSKSQLLRKNYFSTPTVMLRKNIDIRFPLRRYSEDYMLWLLIISQYPDGLFYINKPLTYLHKSSYGESGLSSNLWRMEAGELQNYYKLYSTNNINVWQLLITTSFSVMKFLRRLLTCYLKK